MWPVTILRILLVALIGISMFCMLLYVFGFCEGQFIKRRTRTMRKEQKTAKTKISIIYFSILFLVIILGFSIIKLNIRGVQ